MKIIWACVFIIALGLGCNSSGEKIDTAAKKHDAALVSATERIKRADEKLESIPTPPPQVGEARAELGGAVKDIGVAQAAASELKAMAKTEVEKNKKLNEQWVSPRMRRFFVGVGVLVALVGLAIVLLRYGGLGGMLASIPILGMVLAKIGLRKR